MQENPGEFDIDTAPSPEQRDVFIDCEFTNLVDPELLSIGLVADDGRELYVELTGAEHLANASTYVLDTDIPQFGLVGYQETSRIDIGKRVGAWLLGFGEASIAVRFDYLADMVLLKAVLRSAGTLD